MFALLHETNGIQKLAEIKKKNRQASTQYKVKKTPRNKPQHETRSGKSKHETVKKVKYLLRFMKM